MQIRRDCYWYTWGGDSGKAFTIYPRAYGARCEHPEVSSFFADHNKIIDGRELHNLKPDCDQCPYIQSEIEQESNEAMLQS